jgi:alpha-D-xyloside xylohydrolase
MRRTHIIAATLCIGLQAALLPAAAPPDWTLDSANVQLQVWSDYHYSLIQRSTGAVLLAENQTNLPSSGATVTGFNRQSATGTSLTGALTLSNGQSGQLQFTFPSPDQLHINLSVTGTQPTSIQERFTDQSEHYYGVWETAYPTNLDNRGISASYNGVESTTAKDVFASSARAPFYMTSKNIGVYVPTQSSGQFTFAVSNNTSFSFNQSSLSYDVMYGSDYKQILGQYRALAGPSLMPPDWAFGTIWWRDDSTRLPQYNDGTRAGGAANAQQLVSEDAAKLQQYHIPATGMWLDRPYGTETRNVDANVAGWGNMDYDPSDFPDPDAMVQDLDSRGMKLMGWIANKANNLLYTEASANGYLLPSSSLSPAVDLRNPAANAWFKSRLDDLLMAATLADGSAGLYGYKIDRGGEGEMASSLINQETVLFQQLASETLAARHPNEGFQFARNIADTARQTTAVWSGDPKTTWTGFQSAVRNGVRSGLIYFPVWGSDTGGYSGGAAPTEELFSRWMSFSAYTPMMEILQDQKRNIWFNYSSALLDTTVKYTQTHQDLIPYVRALTWEAAHTGVPVMRAMPLEFPTDSAAADLGNQYMYGPSLLVAPVTTQGANSRSVYLPAGNWLDYNDRTTLRTGGQTITAAAPLGTIPVFVREGAIIPRGDIVKGNNNWSGDWSPRLRVEVFPSQAIDGSFSYYTGNGTAPIYTKLDGTLLRYSAADAGTPGTAEFYLGRFFSMSSIASVTRNGTILTAGTDYTYDSTASVLRVPFSASADVQVRLAPSASFNQWVSGGGTYTDPARWTRSSVPNGPDRVADFIVDPGVATSVTLNTAIILGQLEFDSASSYSLAGTGAITMESAIASVAFINVTRGSHYLHLPLEITTDTVMTMAPGALLQLDHLSIGGQLTIAPASVLQISGINVGLGTGGIANAGELRLSDTGISTIANRITGMGTLTQAGTGTTILTGATNFSGPTIISAGQLSFGGGVSHSIGGVSGTGSLAVAAGIILTSDGVNMPTGSLVVAGTQVIRSSAGNGAYQRFATGQSSSTLTGTSKIAGANLTITGTLDLKNNALIVEAADSTSKAMLLATLAGQLGAQITSSTSTTNSHYTMSLIDNAKLGATMFGGLPVDANSILVTEALKGDADLDGGVGPLDVAIWKADFGVGQYATTDGDFDLDGGVGPLDLALWKANFGASVLSDPAPSDAGTGGLGALPTATFGVVSTVPEPASLAALGVGAVLLLRRRHRR